ncbi:glycosyltransferase [Mycetocola reblochoni]|uniref:Glycosyl transferase, group 1 n=2 Tax=Mycetocola reblochoni TaxID=331618 RepID=A0A1R4K0Q7_9MICO|nr:glycosyltransferase [Mycetocola reblochoni]RLP70464.1 glycosyltransferase [Mycetocola reblochoni]SJN37930.1 Glycosyl transferase, group 1 [Mycetocola reblochoni REB411]
MILGFGSYDTGKHPRVGIILDGLREHGAEVAEINHPLGFSTAERVRMLAQPWRLPAFGWRMLRCWWLMAADARRLRRTGARVDAVVVGYMGHFDVLVARRLFRRVPIVLDHLIFAGDTAQDRGATGLKVRLLNRLDRAATSAADIVVVDTEEHRALLPDPDRGVVVPVGARQEWFDAAARAAHGASTAGSPVPTGTAHGADGRAADPGDGRLSVIFFGLFTPLQGAPVIAEALRIASGAGAPVRATLVGTGQDYDAARAILDGTDGVEWIDWVDHRELPDLVAAHDVCLGIFADTAKALRVVPNKVYEGLAAGCAVVTSDTGPQRRALGDALALVAPADPSALAAELVSLATDSERLDALRSRSRAGADRVRAAVIVEPLRRRLEQLTGGRP